MRPALTLPRGGDEALRQAYDERLRGLGRRLANAEAADASDETVRERRRSPDEGRMRAQLEVEALVQKVRELCNERRTLKRETSVVDERYGDVIRGLRGDLETAQLRYSEMRSEQTHLRQQLADLGTEHEHERNRLGQLRTSTERNLSAEVHQLEAACRLYNGRLATLQAEAQDCKRKLHQLDEEQGAIEAEACSVVGAASAVGAELDGLQERVRQSEAETRELEEKCSVVGERFGRVMEVSEKENHAQAESLRDKARSIWQKADKQRKAAETTQAKLSAAQAASSQQDRVLQERDATIKRLHEKMQEEREVFLKRQEDFLESQRLALQDQASEIKRRGNMMPVEMHQQMLQEQGEWFASAVGELEEALRRQQRSQEIDRERRLELREKERALREVEREKERQRLMESREQERLSDERARVELMEVEAAQSGASIRCQRLEEDLKDAQDVLLRTEASAAAVEEQRLALAQSLEAASTRMAQLRTSLEDERSAKLKAQAALADARRRQEATRVSAANSSSELGAQDGLRAEWRRLEATWREQQAQIAALDQAASELRRKDGDLQSDVAALHLEKQSMETRLRSTQALKSQLEHELVDKSSACRRQRELTARLRCLFASHADRSRKSALELKAKLREEQAVLLGGIQGRIQQWKWAITRDQAQFHASQACSRDAAGAARNASDGLAVRLETIRASDEQLRIKIDAAMGALSEQRGSAETARSAVRAAEGRAEQLVSCIGSALVNGLAPGVVQGLLSGVCAVRGENTASTESLADLEAELRRGMEEARTSAATSERQRLEDASHRSRVEQELAEATNFARLSERRAVLEAEMHALEAELHAARELKDSDAERDKALCARRSRLADLEEQLNRARKESHLVVERIRAADAKLKESRLVASSTEEREKEDARRPVRNELVEVNAQLDMLRARFESDFPQQTTAWQDHMDQLERTCEASWQKSEAALQEELASLRRDISIVPNVAEDASVLQAYETSITALQEELSTTLFEVQDGASEIRRLRSHHKACVAKAATHRNATRDAERLTSDVADARRRDVADARDAERAAAKRHAEDVASTRLRCDAEATRLEAEARLSLSTLTRRFVDADGDSALQDHADLTRKAERLAERARAHLAATA